MRRLLASTLAAAGLLLGADAGAHRIDELLQATLFAVEPDRVKGTMRLVPGAMVSAQVMAELDSDHDGVFSEDEQRAYAMRVLRDQDMVVDGRTASPLLRSWSFPLPAHIREGIGEIRITYEVQIPKSPHRHSLTVENRHRSSGSVFLANALAPDSAAVRIVSQARNVEQSRYELTWQESAPAVPGAGQGIERWWLDLQLSPLFLLGMRHVAEGTDHLLFLLVLLLPAPLRARRGRWSSPVGMRRSLWHVLRIVTAFTIGHSITLSLAAIGGIRVPDRPVEVLIAVSILVSAVHAIRPLFPGREAAVAGSFGLVHGLAFAATLDRLGVGRWERLAGTLSFNLGIETMQLLVVATVLPSLLLLGTAPVYRGLRIGAATLAAIASSCWVIQRLFDVATPLDTVIATIAARADVLAALLLLFAVATVLRSSRRGGGSAGPRRVRIAAGDGARRSTEVAVAVRERCRP